MNDDPIAKLYARLVENHQQLVSIRKLINKKPDRFNELKMEMMIDIISDTIIDISAYVILSSRKEDDRKVTG